MSRRVLITGGAGYVGSPLVYLLLERGYGVTVIDNLSFGGEALLSVLSHPRFHFIKCDITDSGSLAQVFGNDRFDAVVHLAAIVGDPACAKQPELARQVNWEAANTLLQLSEEHRVSRFLFASTCSNYGKMADPESYVDETSPLVPVSLYAELKVAFEREVIAAAKRGGMATTALRFSTVYGLSPRMRFDLTVNEFTRDLTLGRELEIFGPQFWRPYCHVHDFARAMALVLESDTDKVSGEVFNVGDTSENYTKQMLIDEILKVVPDGRVSYVEKKEDPRNYRVRFEKIRDTLDFRISRTVPAGIREIHEVLTHGVILDPDLPRYRNA